MSVLKRFKELPNKCCAFKDCTNHVVVPIRRMAFSRTNTSGVEIPLSGKNSMCFKHLMMLASCRVGANYLRDHYRQHLTSVCALSEVTFFQKYKETARVLNNLGVTATRTHKVRLTMKMFEVDHINGKHYDNSVENLQTLTIDAHKTKGMVMGDFNPVRKK